MEMNRIRDYVSPELETVMMSVSFSVLAGSDGNTEQGQEGGQIDPWHPTNP